MVDDACRVAQQRLGVGDVAAWPLALAVAAVIPAVHVPAGGVQRRSDMGIAPDVLAQAVDDEQLAARGRSGGPVPGVEAEAVVGPAHDSVRLSATDTEQLKTLDKTVHFTRTWKVAFLIPEGR